MSINYNRIKVADLETNEPNKILITNESGELEFSDIKNLNTGGAKYKIYTAIINQTETNHPVANVLENTIGDITFNYTSVGNYTGSLINAFPEGKTFFIVTAPNSIGSGNMFYIGRIDNNTISLAFRKNTTTFNNIKDAMLEIRVY